MPGADEQVPKFNYLQELVIVLLYMLFRRQVVVFKFSRHLYVLGMYRIPEWIHNGSDDLVRIDVRRELVRKYVCGLGQFLSDT